MEFREYKNKTKTFIIKNVLKTQSNIIYDDVFLLFLCVKDEKYSLLSHRFHSHK